MLAEGNANLLFDAVWSRDTDGESPHKKSAKPGYFTIIGHSPTKGNRVNYKYGYLDIDCGVGKSEADPDRSVSLVNLTKGIVKYFNVNRQRKKAKNKQQEK